MAKFRDVQQGSLEWYRLRLGRPTASNFHRIITPAGKPSTQARVYQNRLIAERLLLMSMDNQLGSVEWVERGKAMEPDAAAAFSFMNGVELQTIGFVTTDDGRLGCSPDRVFRGRTEAVEIKCPAPWTMIGYLLDGPGTDYQAQVQGQILVGDFDVVHFFAYHPQMPAAHYPVHRNESYISGLAGILNLFCDELDVRTEKARALGAYVTFDQPTRPLEQEYPEAQAPAITVIVPDDPGF